MPNESNLDPSDPKSSPNATTGRSNPGSSEPATGAALRAFLLVFVFGMIPVIFVLVYLNLTKEMDVVPQTPSIAEPQLAESTSGPATVSVPTPQLPPLNLIDVTDECGVWVEPQTPSNLSRKTAPSLGYGVAVFDFDNDGHQDLLFANHGASSAKSGATSSGCRLYRGNGKFQFEDVTKATGMDAPGDAIGVAVGDYDNDGDRDVYLTASGENRLLRNDDGAFHDVTVAANCAGSTQHLSTSAMFVDYDNDGRLDLFVCGGSNPTDTESNESGERRRVVLFHNEGDGVFQDVTEQAGLTVSAEQTDQPLSVAMGIVAIDLNRDGTLDLVVTNDGASSYIFENRSDGTFTETSATSGIQAMQPEPGVRASGVDAAIFREDGTLALTIASPATGSKSLYMLPPRRAKWVDATSYTGFDASSEPSESYGILFCDLDLDCRPEIVCVNGGDRSPQVFWNAGRDAEHELTNLPSESTGPAFAEAIDGRTAAYGDFDDDGDMDLVITNHIGTPKVFRNDQVSENHYLRFRLTGTRCNRDSIGAMVTVIADGKRQTQLVSPTHGYLSQSQVELNFGLGPATKVERAEVQWPGEEPQAISIESVDRLYEIKQPSSPAADRS
ncbi:CRTAC1 family protein [Rhodopirellula sp. MGV]|uniref:CRTAC1 family protein n=1 Tax=Rhodopirellula sp. MGV TaxID=2023130 RepID=UPI000B97BAF5|nr:CRTAC1 family protein [Rhodopirellula sp. MGV]OYP36655.1 hypothetical protein CGZ80_07670 [Rhodopirellula sp. MGV]PNY36084.1 CRTAC1 family protein [Rhodopirellula baltica]PNY36124.1 CRTAC1 family protein [Rhodopirellula baltica]